jgi:hypothetical protein
MLAGRPARVDVQACPAPIESHGPNPLWTVRSRRARRFVSMVDQDHDACVSSWMRRAAKDLPSDRLVRAFEEAFGALWRRAHQTLGDITLMAIVDRVLYSAAERFPVLSTLEVDATGLRCEKLRENALDVPPDQLMGALRFVLVEFLTVLGNLTADILTSALHSTLGRIGSDETNPDGKEAEGNLRSLAHKVGKDAKS